MNVVILVKAYTMTFEIKTIVLFYLNYYSDNYTYSSANSNRGFEEYETFANLLNATFKVKILIEPYAILDR